MTLVVIIVGFGALLIFAWRLAFRVRRLQHEAETAIDQQGRIRGSISGSSAGDEIGALSLSLEAILQRLSQYNHYLEQMAGRLSHELRTPVAVVRSSLDNLRSTAISTEGAVYVARADEGVQRLSSLIARMSEASRLESMLVGADRERCDMVRLIAGCVEGYELAYPASQFLFVPPPKPVAMNVIADAIAQMLDKLVQNAVDFARADSTIKVVLEKSADGVCIRVENKGQPLAEAAASTLFTSMVSSRGEGADTGSHLGLGLYIVRVIAEHHDGHASARNLDDGSGVRFEVLLSA